MNREELRTTVHASLKAVAPEVDPERLDESADVREEFDLDSMDFLNFIRALHTKLGVDIPEQDYQKLSSLSGAVSYLSQKLAVA